MPSTDSSADTEVSLFDIGMPGALTVPQVQALDLDHWLLFFRKNFVHMEVCHFLSFLGELAMANYK